MLKRVLTMLLALVLCLGLPCVALADTPKDTDPPQWKEWGYDSLEELLNDWDATEEEYYDWIAWDVAMEYEYQGWKEDYLAAHPNFVAQLLEEDAKDPRWSYWGWESQQEYEDFWGESYADLLVDWELEDLFWDQWHAEQLLRRRVEMGGPAEGVGVMWMGEYVQFPDAQPAMVNNRTMVPVRALMECAGATVDYQDSTVLLKTENTEISFRAGETVATVKKNGETSTIQMDVAPYVEQRRTYVPLRFFSQALGYDVLWDSDYKTAVILDPEAAINQLDQNFGTINRFLAAQETAVTADVQQYDTSFSGKLTVFDTMNGNKTATFSGSGEALISANGIDWRGSYNAGELLDVLLARVPELKEELTPEEAAILDQLRRMEMELIYNAADGVTYMRAPLFHAVDPDFPADAWMKFDSDDDEPSNLTTTHGSSVGAMLYAMATAYGGIESYADMMEAGDMLAEWIGDDHFTTVPGGKELNLDLKKLSEDYQQELLYMLDSVKDFDLKLRVNDDGSAKLTGNLTVDSSYVGTTCSLEMQIGAGKTSVKLSCHVRNMMELTLTGDTTVRATSRVPRTAPPAGATVVDESDYSDYYLDY